MLAGIRAKLYQNVTSFELGIQSVKLTAPAKITPMKAVKVSVCTIIYKMNPPVSSTPHQRSDIHTNKAEHVMLPPPMFGEHKAIHPSVPHPQLNNCAI